MKSECFVVTHLNSSALELVLFIILYRSHTVNKQQINRKSSQFMVQSLFCNYYMKWKIIIKTWPRGIKRRSSVVC